LKYKKNKSQEGSESKVKILRAVDSVALGMDNWVVFSHNGIQMDLLPDLLQFGLALLHLSLEILTNGHPFTIIIRRSEQGLNPFILFIQFFLIKHHAIMVQVDTRFFHQILHIIKVHSRFDVFDIIRVYLLLNIDLGFVNL
jgi:hypothetical protein